MYEEHPAFKSPSVDSCLWRYMNFTRLVSLLNGSSLYFSRAIHLDDPFEGSSSRINYVTRTQSVLTNKLFSPDQKIQILESWTDAKKFVAQNTYVNCWHENQAESEAMWRLYGKDEGVAIRTTFKDLSESFICESPIHIGQVKYIDYNTDQIPLENALLPLFHKRLIFEHEREVRAISLDPEIENMGQDNVETNLNPGKSFEIDISTLANEIVVSPYSKDWFKVLVKDIVKRYELHIPVTKSNISDDPLW